MGLIEFFFALSFLLFLLSTTIGIVCALLMIPITLWKVWRAL